MEEYEQPPATAASAPPINHIEIVGVLVTGSPRNGKATTGPVHAVRSMGRYSAHVHRLLLQIAEEDGAVYTLPLDVPSALPEHHALLAALHVGDRVRVVGRLRMDSTYDRRFATTANPDGRPTTQVLVAVQHLAAATDADIDGSWAHLVGCISVPPSIRRHEQAPDDAVARTSLVVEWNEPSRRAGSRQQITRIDRVPLDVPLAVTGSDNALRAGNRVRIEGRLEPFQRRLRPDANAVVQQHLATLQTQWQADTATLSPPERTRREREQVQQLRRLQSEQRLRVRAGYIALLDGTPLSVDAAQAAHAAWVTQQQQRRARRSSAPGDTTHSTGST